MHKLFKLENFHNIYNKLKKLIYNLLILHLVKKN
jgi:hypothetical protein